MKTLLVPTDFSETARYAIDFSAEMAKKIDAEVYLLHVLYAPDTDTGLGTGGSWADASDTVMTVPYMIKRLKLLKGQMQDLIKGSKLYGLKVYDEIETGEAAIKIPDAADKYDADLIIMGAHGVSGLKEVFVGSTSEKVVQHTKRPVLTIKNPVTRDIKKIVFASDFSNESSSVFKKVMEFATVFQAEVQLLTVAKDDTAPHLQRIRNFLYRNNIELAHSVYPDSNTERGIIDFASKANADVIAIGTHGRSGFARLFSPSVSEHLVNHSFLPVLTVNT